MKAMIMLILNIKYCTADDCRLMTKIVFAGIIPLARCDSHSILEEFKKFYTTNYIVVVVVIQFLSSVVPLAEMAGFTPLLLQLLTLRPSTCLVSGHPPSSNQSSLSSLSLASSRSSSVVLAFSCHSLQDSEQPSKHYRHPSSAHVHTI